ncbi:MAG: helix-turn-helix domain-containing protein [Chlamydiia bacterium]|nr:helix-turn-helix domain-containing protein [Chlamydiia bacterium]MCP5491963.1 helix-turn-helix domain-containing protein [Chlamydiales bacterium]
MASEEIKRIGQFFRAKRKERSLSVKDVENATSIRSNYLDAIEEGRLDEFLSSVYALGFMRQYANFLNIDIEKIIREYPQAFKLPTQNYDFAYGIGTLEVRGHMGGGVKWLPNLLWAGAAVAVLTCAYFVARNFGLF